MMLNDQHLAENLKEIFPEHGDFSYEEFILQQVLWHLIKSPLRSAQKSKILFFENRVLIFQHIVESVHTFSFMLQESVYESILASVKNNCSTSDHSQEGQSLHGGSFDLQLALDEALARSLQEDFDKVCIAEHGSNAAGSTDGPRETTVRDNAETIMQDDADPDNMTYEQLQSLGETVGSESRGLPEHVISQLPTFKYKTGFFSKKMKMEQQECVICCMSYKNGDRIMTLPCAHLYHAQCISRWLTITKNCPVCQVEVQDE